MRARTPTHWRRGLPLARAWQVFKYLELFPSGDLEYFLTHTEVPTTLAFSAGAGSSSGAGPSGTGPTNVVSIDDDDD